jgi:protease-4
MRRFIVGFFAIIGFACFLLIVVLAVGVWFVASPGEKPLAENGILTLDLTKPLAEGAPDDGIERVFLGEQSTLRDVLDGIERAQADPRIKGILARIGDSELGTARAQELRDALAQFRAKGKFALA